MMMMMMMIIIIIRKDIMPERGPGPGQGSEPRAPRVNEAVDAATAVEAANKEFAGREVTVEAISKSFTSAAREFAQASDPEYHRSPKQIARKHRELVGSADDMLKGVDGVEEETSSLVADVQNISDQGGISVTERTPMVIDSLRRGLGVSLKNHVHTNLEKGPVDHSEPGVEIVDPLINVYETNVDGVYNIRTESGSLESGEWYYKLDNPAQAETVSL